MRKQLLILCILASNVFSVNGCSAARDLQDKDCGILGSAVSAASYVIIGEFGDSIPPDLPNIFLSTIKGNIPDEYFNELIKYELEIKPKERYYFLTVIHPKTKSIILFDYSCTPAPDGLVCMEPTKYDLNNIELYNTCK